MRKAIKAAGAFLLYLPAYSPDLNPIEQVFAKLKALLRHAAQRTIADLLESFPPHECSNYFRNCEYGSLQS